MKLGIALPQNGPIASAEAIAGMAKFAEDLGYESLWVLDRILWPLKPQAPYGATADGSLPTEYKRSLSPFITLATAAAHTSRVAIGSSVLILPYYNPVLLARELASLDIVSNGRLCIGMGTGWSPDEYEAVGVPMNERAKRAHEALDLIEKLWTVDQPEHDGTFFKLPKSDVQLRPIQKPRPPIYMAAYAPGPMKRVAEKTDGWMPVGIPPEGMQAMFGQIKDMAAAAGRDASALKLVVRANIGMLDAAMPGDNRPIFVGSKDQIAEDIKRTRDIGADELFFDVEFSPGMDTFDKQRTLLESLYESAQ